MAAQQIEVSNVHVSELVLVYLTEFYTELALGDFYQFDIVTLTWTELGGGLATGSPPSARTGFGFVASGSKLFVYGGSTSGSAFFGIVQTAALLLSLAS